MRIWQPALKLLAGLACGLGLLACSSQPDTRSVLQLNFKQDVPSLDPADVRTETGIRLTQQLFTGLVALDDSLRIVPALAKSWTISESGRTYRFRLRDDVYFHPHPAFDTPDSTRRVTARDVVYSLTRILNPKDASVGAWVFNGRVVGAADYLNAEADTVSGFKFNNDTSLSIRLTAPFRPFLAMLTMPYAYVVPREVIESGHDFKRLPIGSGPFRMFKREPGQYTILHTNAQYYDGAPKLDAVQVSFIGEPTTQYTRLKQEQLHLMENPPPAIFKELIDSSGQLHPKFEGNYHYLKNTQLSTAFLGINLEKALAEGHPLAEPTARHQLSRTIPRNQLPQIALGCTPGGSLVPSALLAAEYKRGYASRQVDASIDQPLTLHIANTERRVQTPEDLAGLKLRTVVADLPQELVRALGASPTP
ncbi:MAG: ABC transporter substrate-binding protein, partial [Bacteroidota bacterium]